MKIYSLLPSLCILLICFCTSGCGREKEFLASKPNDALSTISTLKDCQLVLQNENVFNSGDVGATTISSDEYYISDEVYDNDLANQERKFYTWSSKIYDEGELAFDWNDGYKKVYYSNVVLDALKNISTDASQAALRNEVQGAALFYRSFAFFNLVQAYALPYDGPGADKLPGIPLRTSPDINIHYGRACQKDCYDRICTDLVAAAGLLPRNSGLVTKPGKFAAYAMLARVHLSLANYSKAGLYADSALMINNSLTDYNTLDWVDYYFTDISAYPLSEDVFHSTMAGYGVIGFVRAVVDSGLYKLYHDNDLRKIFYFQEYNGAIRFKGSYEFRNFGTQYTGLATDEMYLVRAECAARNGRAGDAMDDINTLLLKRYITGTYRPYGAVSPEVALSVVLNERRKELLFRGIRWTDLRRLNKEAGFAVTLKRMVKGQEYTLPANDRKYALPLPDAEVRLNGIPQNER